MAEDAPNPPGRPSKFRPEYVEQTRKLCELGATDREIAEFFDVDRMTLYAWRRQHEELAEAMRVGKEHADERVVQSLYHRANGYSFDSEEIFCQGGMVTRAPCVKHVPPDVTACIFWLKNRRREDWRDRHEHTGPDGAGIPVNAVVNVTVGGQ